MQEVAEITRRWARASARNFPRWEVDELHNEAFIIAVALLDAGRYDPERAALSTFLWHALPRDVRHRYRRANGERYVTDEDGKRRYRRVEVTGTEHAEQAESKWDGMVHTVGPDLSHGDEWITLRLAGYTASELRARGISYSEQRAGAERLRETRARDDN